jgi:hypothetical protein
MKATQADQQKLIELTVAAWGGGGDTILEAVGDAVICVTSCWRPCGECGGTLRFGVYYASPELDPFSLCFGFAHFMICD